MPVVEVEAILQVMESVICVEQLHIATTTRIELLKEKASVLSSLLIVVCHIFSKVYNFDIPLNFKKEYVQ